MGVQISDLVQEIADRHDITKADAAAGVDAHLRQLAVRFAGVYETDTVVSEHAAHSARVSFMVTNPNIGPLAQAVVDAVAANEDAQMTSDDALMRRNEAIRAALAGDVSYRELEELTGLKRSTLDTIRRGERSRRSPR